VIFKPGSGASKKMKKLIKHTLSKAFKEIVGVVVLNLTITGKTTGEIVGLSVMNQPYKLCHALCIDISYISHM
jgi:hypothetical protein